MRKKKHDIVQVLDPEDVTDLTDAQKELYISLGYQPCLLSSGKIKWLNQGQQVSTLVRPQGWSRLIPKKKTNITSYKRRRRRYSNPVRVFLKENWVFLVLLVLIGLAIYFTLKYLA